MENSSQTIKCPACLHTSAIFFVRKNSHDVYACKACRTLFVYPMAPSPSLYNEDYFAGAESGFGYVDYDRDKLPMERTFEKYLDRIIVKRVQCKTLLDVGAATGTFVELSQKRGLVSEGVEVSSYAVSLAKKKGLQVDHGTLQNVHPGKKFDVISYLDVFEHIPYPAQEIRLIHSLLNHGGLLVLNTPNAQSMYGRLLGKRWHLIVPPEHLILYSRKGLHTFLEKNGFKVIESGTIGKRFTLQYILHVLHHWQKLSFWKRLAQWVEKNKLGRFGLPINLRDNMFIIAQKI